VIEPQKGLLSGVAAIGGQIGQFIQRTNAEEALRASEMALRRANNELELRVRERTASLGRANVELSREINERNRLERELLTVTEREQRRLGQDLHDDLCQELAAIAFMTRALATRLTGRQIEEATHVDRIAGLVNGAVTHARNIARGLHPVELDSGGLMAALRDLTTRVNSDVRCEFECKKPVAVSESDVALNLYRIAQEAVTNAVKHSRARHIVVALNRIRDETVLTVRDDGAGLPRGSRNGNRGMGMHLMKYRARTIGASLSIKTVKPSGTQVSCSLPIK
jgi:signal transduction histidine kinase